MRYLRFENLAKDLKEVPEGEIFTVHTLHEESTLKEKPSVWAFGIKIKGELSLSKWQTEDAKKPEVLESLKQIKTVKKFGWSGTGEKRSDDMGETRKVYQCMYCSSTTFDIDQPCECREGKMTESGIILLR